MDPFLDTTLLHPLEFADAVAEIGYTWAINTAKLYCESQIAPSCPCTKCFRILALIHGATGKLAKDLPDYADIRLPFGIHFASNDFIGFLILDDGSTSKGRATARANTSR